MEWSTVLEMLLAAFAGVVSALVYMYRGKEKLNDEVRELFSKMTGAIEQNNLLKTEIKIVLQKVATGQAICDEIRSILKDDIRNKEK